MLPFTPSPLHPYVLWAGYANTPSPLYLLLLIPLLLFTLILIPWSRRLLLTGPILKTIQRLKLLPKISDTERAAIEAGNAWVEQEFFTGKPDFERILSATYPELSPEIQAFLDGPVEQICQMASDWEIYQRKDLPPAVWDALKRERFFGMMIPKEFGGLGFSNLAYSAVMVKLASRSFTHVATVGVTNSLGPAKLLLRYGTDEQKARYLPRLAIGEEIPCFALTEPNAGSDAASLTSEGEVFRGEDGELYLRLNWRKRYITLGAIRCHPYVYDEIQALETGDVAALDQVLWPHLSSILANGWRSLWLNFTRARWAKAPADGPTAPYYRKLTWTSAHFALLTDLALLTLGGSLKRREKLSGRFADLLAWQYLVAATLRRYAAEGQQAADLPLVHWSLQYSFAQIQVALEGLCANFRFPLLRRLVLPWLRFNPIGSLPSDGLGHQVAQLVQRMGADRDRLTAGIHIPTDPKQALGRLERAFVMSHQAQTVLTKIKAASRAGQLPKGKPQELLDLAYEQGIISETETTLVCEATFARNDAIQVDAFSLQDYGQYGRVAEGQTAVPNSPVTHPPATVMS